MTYVWETGNWPHWRWDAARIEAPLAAARHRQGWLLGRMQAMGFALQREAALGTMTQDVVTTSAIEGETLNREQVRSSLARRLGMDAGGVPVTQRGIDGIVEVTLDAVFRHAAPLTAERLSGWHAALFPTGYSGMRRIRVGGWRRPEDGPMEIVSGPIGGERVHYEAPPAERLGREMAAFLDWFESEDGIDPVLRAALAHLWFVTIHPFEDGNGRIARAISDLALARSERTDHRFYSLSASIRADRDAYYAVLEATQKGDGDVTDWLGWFLGRLAHAIAEAGGTVGGVLRKAAFWERHRASGFNERQIKVLNRLLDGGFDGRLTSSEWAKLTKSSQDTATRDLKDLVEKGALRPGDGGGRSTHYVLVQPGDDA
ncbi:Fic family protein [Azospirillum oleiclasticum]|uniref:Fic family protein n=1 Tax=Azospirillum oleiclasticum TaxID=2735135 RepID=UPI003CCE1971